MKEITLYDLPQGLYFDRGYISPKYNLIYYIFRSGKKNKYVFELYKNKLRIFYELKNNKHSEAFFEAKCKHDIDFMYVKKCSFMLANHELSILDIKSIVIETLITDKNNLYVMVYSHNKIINGIKKITSKQHHDLLINFQTYLSIYNSGFPHKIDSYYLQRICDIKQKDLI